MFTILVVVVIISFFQLIITTRHLSSKNKTIYSWPPTTETIIYQTLPSVHINTQLFSFVCIKKIYIWLHCYAGMNTNCWDSKEVTNLRIITLCWSNCRLGFSQGFPRQLISAKTNGGIYDGVYWCWRQNQPFSDNANKVYFG